MCGVRISATERSAADIRTFMTRSSKTLRRMKSTGIDPRGPEWEVPDPRYRVYFHDSKGASDEHEVEGADVTEVLAWAEKRRGDRTFVLYACVPGDALGLLRLYGHDPNER